MKQERGNPDPPETPSGTAEETQSTGDPSLPKRSWRGCFWGVGLVLLLLFVTAGVSWLVLRNRSDERFNQMISERIQSGQALAIDEVIERQLSMPTGVLDTTREWRQTLETFDSVRYQVRAEGLPWVGNSNHPRWPPAKWLDFDDSQSLVKKFRGELITLQLATAGYPQFAVDALRQPQLAPSMLNGIWRAYDFLELSCYVAAHQGQKSELMLRLCSCITFPNVLARHPGHLQDRLELERRSLELLMRAISEVEFEEHELVRFRDLIMGNDAWESVHRYWDYQQALRLMLYNERERFQETAFYQQMLQNPSDLQFLESVESNNRYSPFSGDDAIAFLTQMDQFRSHFQGNPIEQVPLLEKLEDPASRESTGWGGWQQPTARFLVPSVSQLVQETGRVATYRNVALAMLAADHFRVRRNQLPGSLDMAVDGFLNDQPIDYYMGKPVFLVRDRETLQILSLGPNRRDDRLGQDDIGNKLPREKWQAVGSPVNQVD